MSGKSRKIRRLGETNASTSVRILLPDNSFDKSLQGREVVLCKVPDHVRISVGIRAAQDIPDMRNSLPWDLGLARLDVVGNTARCFGYDFQQSLGRSAREPVGGKLVSALPVENAVYFIDCFGHAP